MRITDSMLTNDFLYNINKSRDRMIKLQNDLASGKRVHTVSDDPGATDDILRLTAAVGRNEQYQKNVADGQEFLSNTGLVLDGMGTLLTEAQRIIVQATDGQQAGPLAALADRVDQLLQEAVSLANTKFNGKFVFGGTQTVSAPYEVVTNPGPPPTQTTVYRGNGDVVQYPAGENVVQQVSVTGAEAFGGTAVFDALSALRDSLRAGISPTDADKAAMTQALQTVTGAAGKIGSLLQSMDNTTGHLEEQHMQLLSLLSGEQDTDIAEATLKMKQEETMLEAALNAGSRIIPKSLLDFLK